MVKNCFLERKPPDLFTLGHKSFGEFLAVRGLINLARAENTLDNEVKKSSIEVREFFSELVTASDLDAILRMPNRHAMCITLALGAEGMKLFNEYLESIKESLNSVDTPSRVNNPSLVRFRSSAILAKAFPERRLY